MSEEGLIDIRTPPLVGSELGNATTTSPPTSSCVSVKDGKAVFKQRVIDWSAGIESMKALVAFHEFLGSHRSPLSSFPKEHLSLLAKHVHESDKAIGALLKSLRKTLFPHSQSVDGEAGQLSPSNKISNSVLQDAVMSVATRTNYGIDNAPASLCIWRWEANDPAVVQSALGDRESAATRKVQRVKAKQELYALFDALPEEERISLLKGSKKDKPESKPLSHDSKSETTVQGTEETKLSKINKKALPVPKNKVNEKSAAVMASFFNKASRKRDKPVTSRSDFEKHFIPFAVHKNATLAPINRFRIKPPIKTQVRLDSEIIIIEDDPNGGGTPAVDIDSLRTPPMEIDPETPPKDLLFQFISRVPSFRLVRSSQYEAPLAMSTAGPSTSCQSSIATDTHRRLKYRVDLSVRDIMTGLVEAEVNGDEVETRRLLDLMKDRRKVPVKLLQFHDNVRPPYYGTWTKSSSHVGPRTPFARDLVIFDYSYDSGDEWEEEEIEGVEELISENGSQGEGEDEFEEDDWLVDDEVIEIASGASRSVSPHTNPAIDEKKKRKAESSTTIAAKKRRQIAGPLIPFSKGPIYEEVISIRDYELFNDHSIHLFNDSHLGLDPFAFVSTCVEDYSQFLVQFEAEKRHIMNPTSSSDVPKPESNFVVPAVPPHVLTSSTNGTSLDGTSGVKKGPTFSLPLEHYPAFLRAIDGSDRPKAVLVDELFKQFKNMPGVFSLRKGAIESKLSEVAAKEKKVWKVKQDVWLHVGLSLP